MTPPTRTRRGRIAAKARRRTLREWRRIAGASVLYIRRVEALADGMQDAHERMAYEALGVPNGWWVY